MMAAFSISDATAIEGSDALKFIDQFVAAGADFVRPRHPTFGPDGNGDSIRDLYIPSADTDEVLRYDGSTGAFLDVFVSQGSGGLDGPSDLEFGPDGDLYVSAFEGGMVNQYDGTTGTFIREIANGLNGPIGLTFGSDGALYIASHFGSQVFKYDSSGLSVFVPSGSGGLNHARKALFGPDANGDGNDDLYVASAESWQILRYDGVTGAFINVFTTTDGPAASMEVGPDGDFYVGVAKSPGTEFERFDSETGALIDSLFVSPTSFHFIIDQDSIIYNTNGYDSSILRHGPSSLAAFTVSLSAPSASPVTVDFDTVDGSALAGQDYIATSGAVTFAPGQTSRTILVQTEDNSTMEANESFSVVLSNPQGGVISDGTGVGTIRDDDAKFYVVNDASTDSTFRYDGTGSSGAASTLVSGNTAPRGAASTAAGDLVWVVDANKTVYVYDAGGTLLGSWTAGSLPQNAQVQGIATDGTNIWIVDASSDKVYRYANAASRLSGSQNAASSFRLNKNNKNPTDIVTNGTHLWVVDGSTTDKVFKYTLSGSLVGSWAISGGGGSPTGITLDLGNNSDLWIVDSASDRAYQYVGAASRTSGSQSAATFFPLAAGNTNPQGIADPPTGASASSFAAGAPKKLDVRAAAALARSMATAANSLPSKEASRADQASTLNNAAGNSLAFSPSPAAPRPPVPFAATPSKASASVSAIDVMMAEFGDAVTGKNLKGLALALDTTLDGLLA